ncbi:MAG: hypothetical protein AAFR38_07415 [Planctomycetota bacterium]
MKNTLALAALAGLTSAASADLIVQVVPSASDVGNASSFTFSVLLGNVDPNNRPELVELEVSIVGPGSISGLVPDVNPAFSNAGGVFGQGFSVVDQSASSVSFEIFTELLGAPSDFEFLPELTPLVTFTVDLSNPGAGDNLFINIGASSSSTTGTGAGNLDGFFSTPIDTSFLGTVVSTPTPGAAAVLGLGGLVAARRRR